MVSQVLMWSRRRVVRRTMAQRVALLLTLSCAMYVLVACGGSPSSKPNLSPAVTSSSAVASSAAPSPSATVVTPTSTPTKVGGTAVESVPVPVVTGVPTTGANVLPGAKPPVIPPEAGVHSQTGAIVFVGSLIQALDWGYSTQNSRALTPYYSPSCTPCNNQANSLNQSREASERYSGGHLTLEKVSIGPLGSRGKGRDLALDAMIKVTRFTVLAADGSIKEGPYPAEIDTLRFYLNWTAEGWKVEDSANVIQK